MAENPTEDAFDRASRVALPDGLQALTYAFKIRLTKHEWLAIDYATFATCDYCCETLDTLGEARCQRPQDPLSQEITIKGSLIASPEIINKHFTNNSGSYGGVLSRIASKGPDSTIYLAGCAVSGDLKKHLANVPDAEYYFKKRTAQYTNAADGGFAEWARRVQVTESDIDLLTTLADACGGNVVSIASALARLDHKPNKPRFRVHGLIPAGATTLVMGDHKTGKSTLALELLIGVARKDAQWHGFPLDTSDGGFAVGLLGEDSIEVAYERVRLMTGGEMPPLLNLVPPNSGDLDSILTALGDDKVSLLVVDPARKYFTGDEDSSDAVSEFMTKLENFAAQKKCAVLLLHHLRRNASPRNISDIPTHGRGSNVFFDRPRVTLGVLRRGNETIIGIPRPNGVPLHNFRQSVMFAGELRLRRDEATHRHFVIGGGTAGGTASAAADVEFGRALAAVARLIHENERVTRTGQRGLFKRAPKETAGMSRTAVDAAVEALVSRGDLHCDATGALSLPLTA